MMIMTDIDPLSQIIGEFKIRISAVEKDLEELKVGQQKILDILSQSKGSWKTLIVISGGISFIAALISQGISLLHSITFK
jgi:hypothetical protein